MMTTKPGKYGTLYLFAVTIIPTDPGQLRYEVKRWAYDTDHAFERVAEEMDDWGDDVGPVRRVR
jgi:hypothetical protein